MNTIPIDLYYKEKTLNMPAEITINDAIEVMNRYDDEALSKLLYKAVKAEVKNGSARTNNNGRFVWNINIDLE